MVLTNQEVSRLLRNGARFWIDDDKHPNSNLYYLQYSRSQDCYYILNETISQKTPLKYTFQAVLMHDRLYCTGEVFGKQINTDILFVRITFKD